MTTIEKKCPKCSSAAVHQVGMYWGAGKSEWACRACKHSWVEDITAKPQIRDPFVFGVLDISTGHMTRKDAKKLEEECHDGHAPVYELREYGWLCYVGEIQENWDDMSPAFIKVMETAKELGCDYVRFDRDGREYYPELEKFEW